MIEVTLTLQRDNVAHALASFARKPNDCYSAVR